MHTEHVHIGESIADLRAELADLRAELAHMRQEYAHQRESMREMSMVARVGGWSLDLGTAELTWTEGTYHIHELDPTTRPDLAGGINFYAEAGRPQLVAALERATSEGTSFDLQLPFITATGRHRWVRSIGHAEQQNGKSVRLYGVFQDITEIKQAEILLAQSARTYQLLSERLALAAGAAHFGVWDWDVETGEVQWDDIVYDIYGLPRQHSMTMERWQEFVHPDDLAHVQDVFGILQEQRTAQHMDFRIVRPDGEVRYIHAAQNVVLDAAGAVTRVVGVNLDVTAEKLLEVERARRADLDSLTEVLNHRAFRAAALARLSASTSGHTALIFFDLDAFKILNDAHGHLVGDAALVAFAQVLRTAFPAGATIGRLGGDEFAVLVAGLDNHDEQALMARYLVELAAANAAAELSSQLIASYGVAWSAARDAEVDLEALLRTADINMYRHKRSRIIKLTQSP